MLREKSPDELEIFLPYYVNQSRLLDIYAILNGGYPEYSEITTAVSDEGSMAEKAEATISGGFKLFNFGGSLGGNSKRTSSKTSENREKKVQTVTSVLSIVKSALREKGYLSTIENAKPGQFVLLPVTLSINSIRSLMTEMSDLLKLAGNMKKIGANVNVTEKDNNKIEDTLKTIRVLFAGEEVLFETGEYAIIGNIVDSNLYQSSRADIIGTELKCLAQVKRVFPDGTELMKNTIFTKIKDLNAKQSLADALNTIADGNIFDFEAGAVFSINNKPVYQLEIIALYQ